MGADGVSLDALAEILPAEQAPARIGPDVVISDLEHDSRRVEPGSGFIAIRGATADGHDFVTTAVGNGAAAVVCERELPVAVPQLVVADSRRAMGALAAAVHGHPATAMTMLGVTGTNGKTTVTHMLEGIARAEGLLPGVVGTIGATIGNRRVPLRHTTPESTELQRLFAAMAGDGVQVVMMEVSSHALVQGRVDGITFDAAGFTNLSQDHLDYHGTMDRYFSAKAKLFTEGRIRHGFVVDRGEWGAKMAAVAADPVTTVGLDRPADIEASTVSADVAGTTVAIDFGDGAVVEVTTPLAGWFNAENAILAAAMANHVGWSSASIASGIAAVGAVAGRFERVEAGQPFTVVVDYAHTPEAMAHVVDAVRTMAPGRIIALGGAGGDRDREKRPAMGAALGAADLAVVTSDNPRTEDPLAIVDAVASGVPPGTEMVVEVDRRRAIRAALAAARPGDVVLLLGRGHEPVQDLGSRTEPFSDRDVAAELLDEMMRSQR